LTGTKTMLKEDKIKQELFDKLTTTFADDVIVLEWKGRWERRKGQKAYLSRFNREFDIARFHRTADKFVSPLLIAYELKGIRTRMMGTKIKLYPPTWLSGWDQIEAYLKQNADYAILVTIKRKIQTENIDLIDTVKAKKFVGLIFVEEIKGTVDFEEIVKPSERNPNVNPDLKKTNLVAVSLAERGCTHIQRQEWARKGDFIAIARQNDVRFL